MNPRKWITRKEIAAELDMSTDSVRRNEERLGLSEPVKVRLNARTVLYHRERALAQVSKFTTLPE